MTWSCTLPWPPSSNRKWARNYRGRNLLTNEAKKFRDDVAWLVKGLNSFSPACRLKIKLEMSAPDNRRRDIANYEKRLTDALTKAKVWHDDSQIDDLRIIRRPPGGGNVIVTVNEIVG